MALIKQFPWNQQRGYYKRVWCFGKKIVEKKREATETIKTVIAQYSQSPDYSYFCNQVGAVIASLNSNITQKPVKSSYNT